MSARVYTSTPSFADGSVLEHPPADSTGAMRTDAGNLVYTLVAALTGAATGVSTGPMRGGDYDWAYEAENWNGGSIKLQRKTLRGNWVDAPELGAAKTADGHVQLGIPEGTEVRAVTSGSPINVYSNFAGL